jgi:hypothetical protein
MKSENGAAALAFAFKAASLSPFVFSADLSLPHVPHNRSWYAIWLMVGETKGTAELPAMLQVGLIRWDQSNWKLQPFITTEHSRGSLKFQPIPTDLAGTHRFAISYRSDLVILAMDGRTLLCARRSDFFPDQREPIYLKLAAEVFAVGDEITGVARNITLETGGETVTPMPYAGIKDRGLKFRCDEYRSWTAAGVFDPALPRESYRPVCPTPEPR